MLTTEKEHYEEITRIARLIVNTNTTLCDLKNYRKGLAPTLISLGKLQAEKAAFLELKEKSRLEKKLGAKARR